MDTTIINLPSRVRGDFVTIPVTMTFSGFNWADVSARCHLRKSWDSTGLIAKFSTTGGGSEGTTCTITQTETGKAILNFTASGSFTSTWPTTQLCGDIEVKREDPVWGPYTPVKFILPIVKDATRD